MSNQWDKECTEFYKAYANGETEHIYIGKPGQDIKEINYHEPCGEGDCHYCDIKYNSGITQRIFKPDSVTLAKPFFD